MSVKMLERHPTVGSQRPGLRAGRLETVVRRYSAASAGLQLDFRLLDYPMPISLNLLTRYDDYHNRNIRHQKYKASSPILCDIL